MNSSNSSISNSDDQKTADEELIMNNVPFCLQTSVRELDELVHTHLPDSDLLNRNTPVGKVFRHCTQLCGRGGPSNEEVAAIIRSICDKQKNPATRPPLPLPLPPSHNNEHTNAVVVAVTPSTRNIKTSSASIRSPHDNNSENNIVAITPVTNKTIRCTPKRKRSTMKSQLTDFLTPPKKKRNKESRMVAQIRDFLPLPLKRK